MMIPHRTTTLVSIVVFLALLLLVFSTTSEPAEVVREAAAHVPKPKLSGLGGWKLPFQSTAVHTPPPPEQKNSTSGESKWFSNWDWKNPFSSSVTLDETRSVLPPLLDRPYVYTFYDAVNDEGAREADNKLLLAWRRAWYAQGFKPVVLSRAEAMNNPLYESPEVKEINGSLEPELLKWLAWGNMGTGIFAHPLCFPMAEYDDSFLTYLRRGVDPTYITRLENLNTALLAGEKEKINEVIKTALRSPNLKHAKTLLDVIPRDMFNVEEGEPVAYYEPALITSRYPAVAEKLVQDPVAGRLALVELINSHLHLTFQNTFSSGIAVLKPLPEHTNALVNPSLRLASLLGQCPASTIPTSCPPNKQKCKPCVSKTPMEVKQPASYQNSSSLFTIGTLPHPYTLIILEKQSDDVNTAYIRRETDRDRWLIEATKDILGDKRGGQTRLVTFKQAVAGDAGIGRSIWLTVEALPENPEEDIPSSVLDDMEWQFGFIIPRKIDTDSKPDVPKNEPNKEALTKERELLEKARTLLKDKKDHNRVSVKEVAEAWNMADTEAWRFVRAYWARSIVERKKWEEEEKAFAGAKTDSRS